MNPKEIAYYEKIDCRLDYSNTEEMISLFQEAKLLSPESVYRFLEELGNPSIRTYKFKSLKKKIQSVLNYVDANFNDPLKKIALTAIDAKFNRGYLPIKKALILMYKVKKHPGYYSLLNIINYSSRRNQNIKMVDNLYDTIIQDWKETK